MYELNYGSMNYFASYIADGGLFKGPNSQHIYWYQQLGAHKSLGTWTSINMTHH